MRLWKAYTSGHYLNGECCVVSDVLRNIRILGLSLLRTTAVTVQQRVGELVSGPLM